MTTDLPKHIRRVLVAARGMTDPTPDAIAKELGIAVSTVRVHLGTLVTKGFMTSSTQYRVTKRVG